ncbi:MAG: nucleotidyltransferase domain-containing protein [Selenomonas ruminantium]|nr:nucleotidyltransferase domain-containing protein [Selenomonas ruminantium]
MCISSLKKISIIAGFVVQYKEVELVMLFGSRARGDARATSDIGLAVWLEENSPLDKGASL